MARRRGQANTEFIIVVALIAIATIGIVTTYGGNLRHLFGNSADNLAGDETTNGYGKQKNRTATEKTMTTFAQNVAYDTNGQSSQKQTPRPFGGGKAP
jgi:Flp pilus assembly pilin Flp